MTTSNVKFKKIDPYDTKTTDYCIPLGNIDSYWEAKNLEENSNEKHALNLIESGDEKGKAYPISSDRIENSIKSAFKQFKEYGVTENHVSSNHPICVNFKYVMNCSAILLKT